MMWPAALQPQPRIQDSAMQSAAVQESSSRQPQRRRAASANGSGQSALPPPGNPMTAPSAATGQPVAPTVDVLQALLQAQQELLQLHREHALSQANWTTPRAVLHARDPHLRPTFQKWARSFKHAVNHYATAADLKTKYDGCVASGVLIKALQDESVRKWQWPEAYAGQASKLGEAPQGSTFMPGQYDLHRDWLALRKRHAAECDRFIRVTNDGVLNFMNPIYNRSIRLNCCWMHWTAMSQNMAWWLLAPRSSICTSLLRNSANCIFERLCREHKVVSLRTGMIR